MTIHKSPWVAATGLISLISGLSNIPLCLSTKFSFTIFSFQGLLSCTQVEAVVNIAAVNGVPASCGFLVFPTYRPMSGSALCFAALFFRCFRKHSTLLQSGRWQFTFPLQHNKAPFSPLLVLHIWFLPFVRMVLFSDSKWYLFVVLICIARFFGWPKRAYAFFLNIFWKFNLRDSFFCLID